MEAAILKHILNSQGSVNREELEWNLDASLIAHIIASNEQFVNCSARGTERVVVRSGVRLCQDKMCSGCRGLHVCKKLLLTGDCLFQHTRRGCHFSHDLQSEDNMELLSEFGLQTLCRSELSLLLLQSNNTLLPQICHDFNNRVSCQENCPRLHMCERYLHQDCSCPKNHNFCAPQPLRLLQEKHIPEHLFHLLRSVYANKEALRLADKANRSRDGHAAPTQDGNSD
ncbi:unnamed protein product [Knipowitschia caucasica]|uniref:PARP12-like CCCH zinc finger tandem domain-containing protein n=1 Tax=Knipowitschia caucasica TaxID=637954 RepID=A0AAV2IYY9_KNICA